MSHILDIIIKATDQATQTTKKVEQSIKNMGNSTTTTGTKFEGLKNKVTGVAGKIRDKWKNMSSEMKTAIGTALTGAGLVVSNFLKDCISTTKEAEKGWIAYKNSLQVVTGQTVKDTTAMKEAVVDMANKTGRSTADVRTAMTNFMNKGLDYATAQKAAYAASGMAAAGLAQDEASASQMVISALNGRAMALKKLGLDINDYKDKVTGQIDTERLLTDITNKTKGAQEEYANSATAVSQRLDNAMGSLKTSIGSVALQALEPMVQVLAQVVSAFNSLPRPIKTVTAVALMMFAGISMLAGPLMSLIGLLEMMGIELTFAAVAENAKAVADGVATASQWLLNAAMDANPIGLVVIAIFALIAALTYLYYNNETVRAVVDALASALGDGLGGALKWVQGAIKNTISFFQNLWNDLNNGITKIKQFGDFFLQIFTLLAGGIPGLILQLITGSNPLLNKFVTIGKNAASKFLTSVVNFIKQLPPKVWTYLKQVASKILSAGGSWSSSAKSAGLRIVSGVVSGLSGLASAVFGKFKGVTDAINRAATGAISAAGNFGSRMLAKFKAVINSASPSDFYKIPYHDFNAIEGIINDARPGAVRAVGRFGKDMMNAYDGTGFSLDTDLSKNSNVKVQQTIKLDHDFSNLPSGVSAEEVARIVNRTAGSDEFGKVLASNVGFQREDSVMKGRLSRRVSRLGGA